MVEQSAAFLLPIATHVLFASCKGAVAVAIVLLCRRLFAGRLSAGLRHGLWLVVLAALLLPVGFELLPLGGDPVISQAVAVPLPAAIPEAVGSTHSVPTLLPVAKARPGGMPVQSWAVLLWAVVVIGLATIPALNLLRYRRIAAKANSLGGPAMDLLFRCRMQMRMHREVRLLESSEVASPAVFGWLSPTLLLPIGLLQQLDATQLRHVFLHELAHVQRHDILINWLSTAAQILHWFNPLVWHGLRVMRADMEQACDARVLGLLLPQEHADYGRTLIGVLDSFPGRAPAQALGVVEGHRQLKERIIMIANFKSGKIGSPLLAAILLLAVASVALTQPQTGAKPSTAIAAQPSMAPKANATTLQAPTTQAAPVSQMPPTSQLAQASQSRPVAAAPRTDAAEAVPAPRATVAAPAVVGATASANVYSMEQLIEQVSKNIHKRIITDPRARANITLFGQKLDEIDYPGLLTILRVNGFTAVELNGYISVVPIEVVRTLPLPIVVGTESYPEDQFVSARIGLTNACAAPLSSMLRQWLSPYAVLSADPNSNSILIVDTFAGFKRIRSTVRDLDASSRSSSQCESRPATPAATAPAPKS